MSNIAAQAASLGMTGSQVTNAALNPGGLFGGQSAAQWVANQVSQNNAAGAAQNLAQQQLASQGITPLGQAQSAISGGIAGIANQIQGAGAAENAGIQAAQEAAMVAGGNPYADDQANSITAGMAVGDAPIATAGNFNPKVQFAAARMFGPQRYKRKPLINF
tara:strand:+ start:75 stop:560 length:486 start_codon:yes stop_codon:yes gene_type:complete